MAVLKATTALASEYAVLDRRKKDLERHLAEVKMEMKPLEAQLLQRFADEGLQSLRTNWGPLVYLHRQLWARCNNPEVLAETEWSWMVKPSINTQTLSVEVRNLEHDAEGNIIWPEPEIGAAVSVSEEFAVRVRNS